MSFNLLDLAKGAISDKIMGSIGGILGSDSKATGGAVGAALPALIGGLMKKTSTSGGAADIFGELDKHDGGLLENLGGIFDGGEKQNGMLDMGQGVLKMIFGGGLSGILGTIAKIVGMKSGAIGKLLGVLAPIVMGILGKQKKTAGWDIGNFTSAMASQKDHLPKMDSSLMDSLGVGNLLSSAKGAASDVAGSAGRAVSGGVDKAADVAAGGANLLKLLLPLILLAALAFLAWKFLIAPAVEGADGKEKTIPSATGQPDGTVGLAGGNTGLQMPGQFAKMFTGAKEAISGVTDVPSAEKAGEVFSGFSQKLGTMAPAMSGLPDMAKTKIGESISGFTGEMSGGMLDKAYAIPGVEGALKPSVDDFLKNLGGFGK